MLETSPGVFKDLAQQALAPQDYQFTVFVGGGALILLAGFEIARRVIRRLPQHGDVGFDRPRASRQERTAVTAASRQAVEALLRESDVHDGRRAARLDETVDMLAWLRTSLEGSSPAALALLDAGQFAAASLALREDAESRRQGGDEAKAAARAFAAAARLDRLTLDLAAAAQGFGAAADLVARLEDGSAPGGEEWSLRVEQGRALAAAAQHGEGLDLALAAFDRALRLAPRERALKAWALTQLHRGEALFSHAVAARDLGAAEAAARAYRAALEGWSPRSAPFERARAQHNLGDALHRLAEMDGDLERLRQAEEAYRAALGQRSRRDTPELWAMTQGNLADVLALIGARTSDGDKLREAVAAYRAALGELRRDCAPRQWAQLQNALGAALEAQADHECCEGDYGRRPRQLAVDAYENALSGTTVEREPEQYATTSVSLGDSLLALGEHESVANVEYGEQLLKRAVAAYRGALVAREALPALDAAKIEINLAYALGLLWNSVRDNALLDEALNFVEDAITILEKIGESEHLKGAEEARRTILDALMTRAA